MERSSADCSKTVLNLSHSGLVASRTSPLITLRKKWYACWRERDCLSFRSSRWSKLSNTNAYLKPYSCHFILPHPVVIYGGAVRCGAQRKYLMWIFEAIFRRIVSHCFESVKTPLSTVPFRNRPVRAPSTWKTRPTNARCPKVASTSAELQFKKTNYSEQKTLFFRPHCARVIR